MRRWSYLIPVVFTFFIGSTVLVAGEKSEKNSTTKEVNKGSIKYLEISLEEFSVWPINDKGNCFDLRNKICLMYKFNRKKPPVKSASVEEMIKKDGDINSICSSASAPDVMVELKIGKYEVFTTSPQKNKCFGTIGLKHTFRIEPEDDVVSVTVFDADGTGGINIKREVIGKLSKKIVNELITKGKVTLGPFGKVERLVLSAKVVKEVKIVKEKEEKNRCDGVYRVRLVEFEVEKTREDGRTWDRGFREKARRPDVIIAVRIGQEELKSPQFINTFKKILTSLEKKFLVNKNSTISIKVWDKDPFGKEKIGETLISNICQRLKDSDKVTIGPFGRVKKIVLIFEKVPQ